MNTQLLFALIQLATKIPALAADIKALVSHNGVSEQQWEDAAHILAQNPNAYFPNVFVDVPPVPYTPPPDVPPPPASTNAPYDTAMDGELPDDDALKARGFKTGDWKWMSHNEQTWLVGHPGGALSADAWDFIGAIQ